jgi:uncharacterized damage-inducible protein DinB
MTRAQLETIPAFYKGYVELVKDMDMLEALHASGEAMIALIHSIPENKGEYRYEPGKWSIKELLCHIMDAERIFAYRALRFARNDRTPLSGFEEKDYAAQANAHSRTFKQLAGESRNLRASTIDLFQSFNPEMLLRSGTANNTEMSVLNLGYVIAGHESHHRNIIEERYLK